MSCSIRPLFMVGIKRVGVYTLSGRAGGGVSSHADNTSSIEALLLTIKTSICTLGSPVKCFCVLLFLAYHAPMSMYMKGRQAVFLVCAIIAVCFVALGVKYVRLPSREQVTVCPQKCNVVLIVMDTLAAGHIKTYGYDRDTLPKTSKLFEDEGVIFDHAQSVSPWTLPSFNSIYFSNMPSRITFEDLEASNRVTLQSQLRANKISIKAVSHFGTFIDDAITRLYARDELIPTTNPLYVAKGELKKLSSTTPQFFMLVHSFKAHDPYRPEGEYLTLFGSTTGNEVVTMRDLIIENKAEQPNVALREAYRLRYDQNLAQIDSYLYDVITSIPEEVKKNTVVILTSDHGEAFNEHGKVWHSNSLYQEEVHVPLMMLIPGISARRISEPVSHLDLTPTILSFAHAPQSELFLGESLVPVIEGKEKMHHRTILGMQGAPAFLSGLDLQVFAGNIPKTLRATGAQGSSAPIIEPTMLSARKGDYVYIAKKRRFSPTHWEIYNMKTDPLQQHSLYPKTEVPDSIRAEFFDLLY